MSGWPLQGRRNPLWGMELSVQLLSIRSLYVLLVVCLSAWVLGAALRLSAWVGQLICPQWVRCAGQGGAGAHHKAARADGPAGEGTTWIIATMAELWGSAMVYLLRFACRLIISFCPSYLPEVPGSRHLRLTAEDHLCDDKGNCQDGQQKANQSHCRSDFDFNLLVSFMSGSMEFCTAVSSL